MLLTVEEQSVQRKDPSEPNKTTKLSMENEGTDIFEERVGS